MFQSVVGNAHTLAQSRDEFAYTEIYVCLLINDEN